MPPQRSRTTNQTGFPSRETLEPCKARGGARASGTEVPRQRFGRRSPASLWTHQRVPLCTWQRGQLGRVPLQLGRTHTSPILLSSQLRKRFVVARLNWSNYTRHHGLPPKASRPRSLAKSLDGRACIGTRSRLSWSDAVATGRRRPRGSPTSGRPAARVEPTAHTTPSVSVT